MNSREIDREVRRLADEREWGGFEDPRIEVLLNLFTRREECRRRLQSYIGDMRHNLDGLENMLSRPDSLLNDLGELQGRPAALEAAVGAFTAAQRALRDYLKTYPAKVA